MDSYFKKYLKYKNKYLELKKLYGGVLDNDKIYDSGELQQIINEAKNAKYDIATTIGKSQMAAESIIKDESKNLKLLSEIANYTKKIYYSNSKFPKFMDTFSIYNIIPNFLNDQIKYISSKGFQQDPMIQLYNIDSHKYINLINSLGWEDPKIKSEFGFSQFSQMKRVNPTVVNPIHISEPALQDKIFPVANNYINVKINNQIKDQISLEEQIKGGNFISSPSTEYEKKGVLFYIEPIPDKLREFLNNHLIQPIIPLSCSFKFNLQNAGENIIFRHIDEIMTFLPYGIGKFKIWIYDIKDTENIPRDIYEQLKAEQTDNLERISKALFGSSYEENKEKFFIIPIDIGYPEFLFPEPPIFNLSYIEVRDPAIEPQLFLSSKRKDLDPIIITELESLKSYITDRKVNYQIVDTSNVHKGPGTPGGNLHCLIKQEMEIP